MESPPGPPPSTVIPENQSDSMEIQVEAEVTVNKSPSTTGRISKVWKFFLRFQQGSVRMARCRRCKKTYKYSGTSNLRRHVSRYCPFRDSARIHVEEDVEEFDQDVFRSKVAKALIYHDLPFKFVEYERIRDLFVYLNPKVKSISRNTAKADVLRIYQVEKEKMKAALASVDGRICLTSDLWTSITSKGYMCLTGHYIDPNWTLQSKVLAFRYLPPPHDGESVGRALNCLLQELNIEKKVFTITLDNASYNNRVVSMLRDNLALTDSLVCYGDYLQVRCGAHILNLIVKSGLHVIEGSVNKIRESVKYARATDSRVMRFAECVSQMGIKVSKKLKQDVCVRWNSTYQMLDSALTYKLAFSRLNLVDKDYNSCPTEDEWKRVGKITKFLRPFYVMTELFSGTSYPTANLYFRNVWSIQMLILEEMKSEDPILREMAMTMKPKFDKYWESYSTILSIALILDPRYKLQFIEYAYRKIYIQPEVYEEKVFKLKTDLQYLFEEYLDATNLPLSQSPVPGVHDVDMDQDDEFLDEFDAIQGERRSSKRRCELEKYLAAPLVNRRQFPQLQVLQHWKDNMNDYPVLSTIARDILSIPITTVASESTFSHGGRIIDKYRNPLLPATAETLICTRDWLKVYDFDDEIEEDISTDIEKLVAQVVNMGVGR